MQQGGDQSARAVGEALARAYPDARCELLARDPWELLVAAILSARSTDFQVNRVMAVLNEHYVGPAAFAALDHRDLERAVRHVPLFRQKARAIVEAARAVVLGNAFGIPAIAADVHVQRVAHRLGWSPAEHPAQAEAALAARFPPQQWVRLCHQIIRLGRDCCRRIKPRCARCPLAAFCPRQGVVDGEQRPARQRP